MLFKEKWKTEKENMFGHPLDLVADAYLNELPQGEYMDVIKTLREECLASQVKNSESLGKYMTLKHDYNKYKEKFSRYMRLESKQGKKHGSDDRIISVTAHNLKASHLQKFGFITLLALNEGIIYRETVQNTGKFYFGDAIRDIISGIETWIHSDSLDPRDALPCFVDVVNIFGLKGKNLKIAELLDKQLDEYIKKSRKSIIEIPKS